jgi:hypothetical protein
MVQDAAFRSVRKIEAAAEQILGDRRATRGTMLAAVFRRPMAMTSFFGSNSLVVCDVLKSTYFSYE